MFAGIHPALRWAALAVLSALLVSGLEWLRLPAGLLLGAMAAAVVLASNHADLKVPPPLFYAGQSVVGCMIAHAFPLSVFAEMGQRWPVFLCGVLSVVAASSLLGWLLARWNVLPGSTAVWGSSPGAATAMTLMAESYGADARLVAVMQYLRVVVVATVATLAARLWTSAAPGHAAALPVVWFPPLGWHGFGQTLIVAAVGAVLGRVLRVPAGPLLLPMLGGALLQDADLVTIQLPQWLLACAYVVVGWSIGLRFTRPILGYAARALPRILASIFCLVAICCGFAALLVEFAGVDPLTAYLATSPGGADSVAIIAASTHVDMPFVMAMQTARFLLVLLAGPTIARFVATHAVAAKRSLPAGELE